MFSLIAAIGKNRELGKGGKLVFGLPEDLKYFRETTMGHKILMGRKTWESLPKKLPKRENIVVSRNQNFIDLSLRPSRLSSRDPDAVTWQRPAQCDEVPDLIISDLGEFARKNKDSEEEIFVIGGGMVYWEMMKYAKKLYLTEIEAETEADVFFPEFNKKEWTRTVIREGEDNGVKYAFVVYERK